MQLQPNTTFANRYQLERLLGRGGFSEVWLAKDNWTHLRIALKVYAPGQGMDVNGLQDFCGELANVFDLNHTNLLKPTHVDSWNDMPYLIMAYCSNGSLASKVGQLSEEEIWKLIHDVASGLAYLHSRDVVHQDISPDNILIDDLGNYLVTDFGISSRARSTLRKSVILANSNGGKTAYMGPERFSRQPAPTKASDIWSFGAMIYEVLEGNVPFGEVGGGLQKGGAEIPYIAANVSDALKFTVYKMLSKETWDRPTAETLVAWSQKPQSIEIDYDLLTTEEDHSNDGGSEPIVTTSRQTQRFSSSSSETYGLTLSLDSITALPAANVYHTVDVKSNSVWSATTSVNNAEWLHCHKRNDGELVIWCDKNRKKESRSAHVYVSNENEKKSIYVTQQATTNKGFHTWIWILILLVVGLISSIVIGVNLQEKAKQERQEKQRIYVRHINAISDFEQCLNAADIDHINALNNAYDQLGIIRQTENNSYFDGNRQYVEKKQALKAKAQALYEIADRKYQRAPVGTETERRNLEKRNQIDAIKQRL